VDDPELDKRAKAALISHEWLTKVANMGHPFYQGLKTGMRRFFEGKLEMGPFRELYMSGMMVDIPGKPDPQIYADCMRYDEIHKPTVTYKEVLPHNMEGLFKCFAWMMFFSAFTLIVEELYTLMVHKK
jgi:hypothetical protein